MIIYCGIKRYLHEIPLKWVSIFIYYKFMLQNSPLDVTILLTGNVLRAVFIKLYLNKKKKYV